MIAILLKVFFSLLLVLPVMGHCGSFTLGPGLGVERVNDTFNVDLDIVRGLYRFDNGVTVEGMLTSSAEINFKHIVLQGVILKVAR